MDPTEVRSGWSRRAAAAWLEEVDGRLYRTPPQSGERRAWVAVVRSPKPERKTLIVGIGESMVEAAAVAARQWRELSDQPLH